MIIKTIEKLILEEKLKIANKEEAKIIQQKIDNLDMSKCNHIFIKSDVCSRGECGDEYWISYECINCGLTNKAVTLEKYDMESEVHREWSRIGLIGSPAIYDEDFYFAFIQGLYEKALNNAEDQFDREEVAYLLKKYIRGAKDIVEKNKELVKRKQNIDLIDKKLAELSKLPIKELGDIKFKYYVDYFNTHRREYSLLEDIPPFEYFKASSNRTHPLGEYSALNIILIGQFIKQLFKKYENKDVESYIKVRRYKKSDYRSEMRSFVEKPNIIIGNPEDEKTCDPFENKENIIIPFKDSYETFYKEGCVSGNIKYLDGRDSSDAKIDFLPKRQLISNNEELYNLDYKDHTFIRDLIYSLAYYQKEAGVREVDDEHLKTAFKRIYKL